MAGNSCEYVLVEWIADEGLSIERSKQIHTSDNPPIVNKVYAIEYREGPGRVEVYQGKVLAVGDKRSMQDAIAELTGENLPDGGSEPASKRPRKAPRHLDDFLKSCSTPTPFHSNSKSKSKATPIQKARKVLVTDVSSVETLPDEDFEELDQLRRRVKELERENRNLLAQIDIQETLKQLKKIVRKLTTVEFSQHNSSDEVPREMEELESTLSFEHLQYRPSDVGVVELKKGYGVYLLRTEKLGASTAKSDTTMARNLMCRIFKREALLQCSVKGNVARGKGASGKAQERKPPLNPRGVNAIIDYVTEKFKKTMDRAPVLVCAMGTRLSELRADAKVNEALLSVSDDEATQIDLALNAFGIPNTGLLAGTRSWYGHFSGCTELPDFQYCMLTMHVNRATLSMTELHQLSIRWGICAPKICSDNGIHDNVEMLTTYLRSSTGVNLTGVSSKAYCVQNNRVPYSSGFYITGGVFGLICVLMTIGSMIDIIDDDNEVKDLHGTETEESLPLMTSAIGKKEEKEAIQEINRQPVKGKVAATIKQILLSFAFNRNLSKLTVVGSDGNRNIGCLHGIRVISMVWIVLLHVCLAIDKKLGYLDMFNPHDGWRMFRSAFYQIIIYNGSLPVDTFLFLSGLLVCNATLFKLEKNNGSLSWPWFFLHRYIRLTPILAVAIAIWVFVAPHMYWGPNMDTFMDRSACESYWWTNLLYIQNFVQMSIQCYPLAWYLSADMQLFLASPFIIYSLYRSQRLGLLLIAVLVSASVIVNGIIVAEYNFYASTTANTMFFGDYLDIIYTKPYIRMQAYLVGMVVGFMIYKAKDKEIILPKPVVLIGWLVATSLTATVLCVTINHHTINPSLGKIVDVTYQSLHRVAWGVFLAWVVIYCHLVKSGWINNFLSWHAWVPLSRLSYTVYIIHLIVFWTFIGNLGQPFYTTSLIMMFNSVAVTCVSFMFAAFLYLSVELPVANLEQKFLPRP